MTQISGGKDVFAATEERIRELEAEVERLTKENKDSERVLGIAEDQVVSYQQIAMENEEKANKLTKENAESKITIKGLSAKCDRFEADKESNAELANSLRVKVERHEKALEGEPGQDSTATNDRAFIEHIQQHLKPGQEVICKICGKTAEEIIESKQA